MSGTPTSEAATGARAGGEPTVLGRRTSPPAKQFGDGHVLDARYRCCRTAGVSHGRPQDPLVVSSCAKEVVAIHAEEAANAVGAPDLARTVRMIVVDGQATAGCIGL